MTSRRQTFYAHVMLGLLAAAVLAPNTPICQSMPGRDSGLFLYVGQQILDGKAPYRDVWDHKGPGIYYIDALGLLIGQGSRWGVWFLEFLSLYAAALLGYRVMSQAFGITSAVFASAMWLISLVFLMRGGNLTEEFALPVQFAALNLFWRSRKSDSISRDMFLIGITFAVSFLLKPNSVGVQLSIAILTFLPGILSPRRYEALRRALALLLGAITIILPVAIYLACSSALSKFLDSFFRYNFIYSTSSLGNRVDSLLQGLRLLAPSGMAVTALATWIVGCLRILHRSRQNEKQTPMLYLALINLPLELLLSSVVGRTYGHYYITWLPAFAILTGSFASGLLTHFSTTEVTFLKRRMGLGSVWVLALLAAMAIQPLREMVPHVVRLLQSNGHESPPTVEHIKSYTDSDDYLLIWGAQAGLNFLTERQSPSRFVYQYPLYTCGYPTEEMLEEFLDDIIENKPVIVDTSPTNAFIPPIDDRNREEWKYVAFAGYETNDCELPPEMDDVFEFVNSNYAVVGFVGPNQWPTYKYAGGE